MQIMPIMPIMIPAINGITSWSEFLICIGAMILGTLIFLAIINIISGLLIATRYIYGRIADWRFERQKNKQ